MTVQQGNKINENKITNRQIKRSNEVGSQYYRKTKVAINKREKEAVERVATSILSQSEDYLVKSNRESGNGRSDIR